MASINVTSIIRVDLGQLRRHVKGLYWLARSAEDVSVGSVRVHLSGDWATKFVRVFIYMDRYEMNERSVLASTLKSSDRYLEAGAGIGVLSALACRMVGDDAVFAYEANPMLLPTIAETMQRNGFEPEVTNAVLGRDHGTTEFFVRSDEFWSSGLHAQAGAVPVRVPVLPFADELERTRATYLMVDIEGGELDLLGNEPLPQHVRAICVETHPGIVGAKPTQRLLQKLMDEGFLLNLQDSRNAVAYLERG